MMVKDRILKILLLERIEKNKEYAASIGVKNVSTFKGKNIETYKKVRN